MKVAVARAIGVAHRDGGVCEDAAVATCVRDLSGGINLLAVVADGAGSAQHGAIGAHIATRMIHRLLAEHLVNFGFPTPVEITTAIMATRAAITLTAKNFSLPTRAFASTLLGAILADDGRIAALQIGDGAIVCQTGEILGLAFAPDNGRYANETHFLADDDWIKHLRLLVQLQSRVDALALTTDGLQRLCLETGPLIPYGPFFRPLFAQLQGSGPSDMPSVSHDLRVWLNAAAINQRTEDDKAIVLACRM